MQYNAKLRTMHCTIKKNLAFSFLLNPQCSIGHTYHATVKKPHLGIKRNELLELTNCNYK